MNNHFENHRPRISMIIYQIQKIAVCICHVLSNNPFQKLSKLFHYPSRGLQLTIEYETLFPWKINTTKILRVGGLQVPSQSNSEEIVNPKARLMLRELLDSGLRRDLLRLTALQRSRCWFYFGDCDWKLSRNLPLDRQRRSVICSRCYFRPVFSYFELRQLQAWETAKVSH